MSLQVFLQARLLGAEEFLAMPVRGGRDDTAETIGRCAWLTLICEVLPRALLRELKLSRMLLGSSSAEQFLLVLAEEDVPRANGFMTRAADALRQLSGNTLRLIWASTENLGAWPVARRRLDDALFAKTSAPLASTPDPHTVFAPFTDVDEPGSDPYSGSYFRGWAENLHIASRVGWSSERPAELSWDAGQHSWALEEQSAAEDDGILFPRRFAMDEAGRKPSLPEELAQRADGQPRWGVLRGEVDQFEAQLRHVGSIEEHIHLSVLFKEFFAGELSVLCTLSDFWRKVSILYRGAADFAVFGTWDALVLLARELQRVFARFIEENLQTFPDLEGKTMSMALAIAPDTGALLSAVFQEAETRLRAAQATEAGTFHLFGGVLEWKRLSEAEELKASLVRLVRDFGYSPKYIGDLAAVFREASPRRPARREKTFRVDKPWRIYRRLSRVIPQPRGKEASSLRNSMITNLIGKRTAGWKLWPSARVGLEWARLAAGTH